MALSNNDKLCNGCGSRRGEKHCKYPSNPSVNDTVKLENKRGALNTSEECTRRRDNARKISYQNKTSSLS